jgi:integrase
MQNDSTQRKLARHARAHPNLDSRLRKSERTDGTFVFEIRHEVYDPESGTKKRVYETVGTRLDQAKARLAELTTAAAKGERISSVGMTGKEAWEGYKTYRFERAKPVKPRTADSQDDDWRLYIGPRFGPEKIRDVNDPLVVEQFLHGLKRQNGKAQPLSGGTKARVLATLSAVFDHAVKKRAINSNPCHALQRGERPRQGKIEARILTWEEQARLLAYSAGSPWLRPIILTSLYAALRLGEIAGLRWRDVDFANNKLHVRRSRSKDGRTEGLPKGGKEATIDLAPELRKLLLEIMEKSPATGADDFVFANSFGRLRQPRDIQRAFAKARERAALTDEPRAFRFHDLRHTAISRLANAPNAQMPWVQEFARHADIATTYGYVHKIEDQERVKAAWAALNGGQS